MYRAIIFFFIFNTVAKDDDKIDDKIEDKIDDKIIDISEVSL